jgi:membrane-associated protease RseP (regulator of RpoE activity)
MFDLEIVSTIIFFALIGFFLIKDRKNIQFSYGIIIRKWKRGKEIIDRFVKKYENFLRIVGNVAIIIGIGASLVGIYFLVSWTIRLKQAFALVLPTVAGYQIPGPVISIPFWYWIVGVFVVIASHETMHAIFSRAAKIPIKSYGVLLLFLFPIGAFVDIDIKKVKKLKLAKKLRIFAAGSFGNFLVGLIVFLLFMASTNVSDRLIESVGIKFKPIPNTPAAEVNLTGIIYQIDNQTIKDRTDLANVLNQTKIGQNITIFTTSGSFTLKTTEHPEIKGRAYIGITEINEVYKYKIFLKGYVPEYLVNSLLVWYKLLVWLTLLSVGVGMANLLPMKPFDGGYIFEEIFTKFFGKKGKIAIAICSIIIFCLILINLFGINLIKALI